MIEEELEDTESQEEQELFEHFRFEVSAGTKPIRIDKYLANSIQNASRSKIQNAIDAESVLVNEKPTKASYKIKPDDIISVVFPDPPKDTTIAPENIPLNIVYEDDDILIVNKVAGMVVHPGYNNVTGTLVNALAYHFKDLAFAQENNIRPGLVHRIDKNTSGLLVVAKNEFAMTFLAKQFFDHSIKRQYIALAWGDFDEDEGTVDGYIGRSNYDRRVFKMYKDDEIDKGKWSVTHYKVLERLHYVTLIECRLETGRTHQIRVHMKDIGHPLFADDTYGGDIIVKGTTFTKYKQFIDNCFDLCQRQALHARSIGFIHPTTKKEVFFETDLPSDMQAVIEKWRGYHKNVISKEDE